MTIQWYGQGCIKLQTKEVTIVIDPFDPKETGLRLPRTTPTIRLLAARPVKKSPTPGIEGETFVVDSPGEFESKGIAVTGVRSPSSSPETEEVLYLLQAEGMSIGHLGPLRTLLTNTELETLEGADLLFVPVGGKNVLTAKQANETISSIEPRVVIPVYYAIPGLKIPQEPLTAFTREVGVKNTEAVETLRLAAKDLPQDETKFFFLSPS